MTVVIMANMTGAITANRIAGAAIAATIMIAADTTLRDIIADIVTTVITGTRRAATTAITIATVPQGIIGPITVMSCTSAITMRRAIVLAGAITTMAEQ
ncbi:MAG: hypothetical protein AAFY43_01280 [Pseudomonadota bacterium]